MDLRHQLRPNPVHAGCLLGRASAREGAVLGLDRRQSRQDHVDDVAPEPGADPAHVDQVAIAVDSGEQRAELLARGGPAADHHLLAFPGLRLAPAVAAAGLIGRVEALRDDALEAHAAGRLEHVLPGRDEVLDVADVGRRACDQGL